MTGDETLWCQQPAVGGLWDLWTLDLAVGFWERPESVLQTH